MIPVLVPSIALSHIAGSVSREISSAEHIVSVQQFLRATGSEVVSPILLGNILSSGIEEK